MMRWDDKHARLAAELASLGYERIGVSHLDEMTGDPDTDSARRSAKVLQLTEAVYAEMPELKRKVELERDLQVLANFVADSTLEALPFPIARSLVSVFGLQARAVAKAFAPQSSSPWRFSGRRRRPTERFDSQIPKPREQRDFDRLCFEIFELYKLNREHGVRAPVDLALETVVRRPGVFVGADRLRKIFQAWCTRRRAIGFVDALDAERVASDPDFRPRHRVSELPTRGAPKWSR